MGDICIHRRNIPMIGRLNGRKKLLRGNHDCFRLKDYAPYFDDIDAYRIYPEQGIIVSHIPVHTCQLERRFKFNVHGHLHSNIVTKDVPKVVEIDCPMISLMKLFQILDTSICASNTRALNL